MSINALGGFSVIVGVGQTEGESIKKGVCNEVFSAVVTKDEKNKAESISTRIVIENGKIKTAMFTINEYMEDGVPREYALYAHNDGTVTSSVPERFTTPKAARERLVNYLEGILKRDDFNSTNRSVYEFVLKKITPQQ
ncbi:MAG: hypothetical protein PHH14_02635 [Candidatus Margulisbacteria bacterium]|nr:hypothetical protein [Candidatus Margulisiibacteriota bacterium]